MPSPAIGTRSPNWKVYVISFLITAALFGTAFYLASFFNAQRLADVRSTQDTIAVDILSQETQFDLLAEHSCSDISENSVLSRELQPLGERLDYLERTRGTSDDELLRLKRYYSLLEIKDILLMEKVADKCHLKPVFILYFYSNAGDCKDCETQGYVLTALSEKYPTLRVYSFDYNLDLSALKTLISIHDVDTPLPALVIKNKVHNGFQGLEDIEKTLPELAKLQNASSTVQKK
jgi:hypothetical protein